MACMETMCLNPECLWTAHDNKIWKKCPLCDSKVHKVFDEADDIARAKWEVSHEIAETEGFTGWDEA